MVDFNKVYEIMKEAFPESERRDFEGQKNLLNEKQYTIVPKYDSTKKSLLAFIASWDFDDFVYIEHIAVSNKGRGQGTGSKFLKDYVTSINKKIVLEVEPPDDDVSKRRIKFYERLGFQMNPFYYEQPPLQEGYRYTRLNIMSYPEKMSQEEFLICKQKIYNTVYKV